MSHFLLSHYVLKVSVVYLLLSAILVRSCSLKIKNVRPGSEWIS